MKSNTRWSREQGSKVIGEWRRSGLTLAAFARRQGIAVHRLRYWRDRVDASDGKAVRKQRQSEKGKLVPGVVVGLGTSRVSLQLPRGVIIEAQEVADIEPEWLTELVVALENA